MYIIKLTELFGTLDKDGSVNLHLCTVITRGGYNSPHSSSTENGDEHKWNHPNRPL